jgi:hypothetical protein
VRSRRLSTFVALLAFLALPACVSRGGAPAPSSAVTPPVAKAIAFGRWGPIGTDVRLRVLRAEVTTAAVLTSDGRRVPAPSGIAWLVTRLEVDNAGRVAWDLASARIVAVDPAGSDIAPSDDSETTGTAPGIEVLAPASEPAAIGEPRKVTAISFAFPVPVDTPLAEARLSVSTPSVAGVYFALR